MQLPDRSIDELEMELGILNHRPLADNPRTQQRGRRIVSTLTGVPAGMLAVVCIM